MPVETQQAVDWALQQEIEMVNDFGMVVGTYPVTKDTPTELVDKVREYFNTNKIEYSSFSYSDLEPYLVEL